MIFWQCKWHAMGLFNLISKKINLLLALMTLPVVYLLYFYVFMATGTYLYFISSFYFFYFCWLSSYFFISSFVSFQIWLMFLLTVWSAMFIVPSSLFIFSKMTFAGHLFTPMLFMLETFYNTFQSLVILKFKKKWTILLVCVD